LSPPMVRAKSYSGNRVVTTTIFFRAEGENGASFFWQAHVNVRQMNKIAAIDIRFKGFKAATVPEIMDNGATLPILGAGEVGLI
jgi:hypothetical protein